MRMSTVQIFQQSVANMLANQSELSHTEQQLATGRRILTPADDPMAAVQILDITEDLALIDQYQRNSNLAQGQLALEDTVLADVSNVLFRVQELALQANNATQSPETRDSIATEVDALIDELLALANTRDASGEYIFAGFQAQSEPFAEQGGDFTYNGDDGQRYVKLGSSSQVAVRDTGIDVFMSIPSGNGTFTVDPDGLNTGSAVAGSTSATSAFVRDDYTMNFSQPADTDPVTYEVLDSSGAVVASGDYVAGDSIEFAGASIQVDGQPADGDSFDIAPAAKQDMFTTLANIVDALTGSGTEPTEIAAVNNAMAQALADLDQALGNVLEVRADVGVRLNHVDNQLNINESFSLQLQSTLSGIQDLDYAEAITRFELELTALQAAQQAYVKMQGLSLFNYL